MDKIVIESAAEARELIRRAVREKGADYVYTETPGEDCHYFEDENRQTLVDGADPTQVKPGCIVGHVLAYKGFDPAADPDKARLIENFDVFALAGVNPHGDVDPTRVVIEAPREVVQMLKAAQNCQDEGHTWGEAERQAETARQAWVQALKAPSA